jgi:hypothetical protein
MSSEILYKYGSTCPKGMIERVSYTRKTSKKPQKKINIKPTCIKDQGKTGKGPKLNILPKYDVGLLSNFGYSLHDSYIIRVKALKKAIKYYNELKILRHVNALRTLFKSNEKYYNKLNKDLKWIQKDYK